MAFEYDGKIYLNLEEQVEVNSRMAVDAKETAEAAEALVDSKADTTYVDTELAKKVTKQTTTSTAKRAYVYDNNGDTNVVISANADSNTLVMRTAAGRIVCNDPGAAGHAATKGYVDTELAKKVTKLTTTSTAKRAYAYDNTGDINVVISADNANGGTIVQRTSAGRIVCNDPNAAGQAATKGYVDNIIAKMSPSVSALTCLDGLTWLNLYTAMSNNVNVFLTNPSSYLYSDTGDTTTTICNQSLHYVKDGSNYHFRVDFYKPNIGILSQAYTITSAGAISYYTI